MSPLHLRCLRKRRAEGEPIPQLADCFELTPRQVIVATIRAFGREGPFPSPMRPIEDAEIAYYMDELAAKRRRNAVSAELNLPLARLCYAVGKWKESHV